VDAQLLQISIVIVGAENNPTVLNPDFLHYNKIVREEWHWRLAAPAISTPPFSQVTYDSGVTITVDPTKIQIVDSSAAPSLENTRILELARSYVTTLCHVRYSATGINFISGLHVPKPSDYLKTRFIRHGSWDTDRHPLNDVGLRFVYPLSDGRIVFSLDSGEVQLPSTEENTPTQTTKAVLINANFHRDCRESYPNTASEVLTHLECAAKDADMYRSLLQNVLLLSV
jgi:hypothetical protein